MKMKTDDFEALKAMIEENWKVMSSRPHFHTTKMEEHKASYLKQGHTLMRYRFDMLWAVPYEKRKAWFDRGIYDYLNDDHIHTALKAIVG